MGIKAAAGARHWSKVGHEFTPGHAPLRRWKGARRWSQQQQRRGCCVRPRGLKCGNAPARVILSFSLRSLPSSLSLSLPQPVLETPPRGKHRPVLQQHAQHRQQAPLCLHLSPSFSHPHCFSAQLTPRFGSALSVSCPHTSDACVRSRPSRSCGLRRRRRRRRPS